MDNGRLIQELRDLTYQVENLEADITEKTTADRSANVNLQVITRQEAIDRMKEIVEAL